MEFRFGLACGSKSVLRTCFGVCTPEVCYSKLLFYNDILRPACLGRVGALRALPPMWARFNDGSKRMAGEGEGACSLLFADRSHLPLRGKLDG